MLMTNWSRARLKEMARIALHGSYWKCVLGVLMSLAGGAAAGSPSIAGAGEAGGGFSASYSAGGGFFNVGGDSILPPIVGTILLSAGIIAILLRIFILSPLEVSCCAFFNRDLYRPSELSELSAGFSRGYLNIVKIMFLRDLYTGLWSLLFIVPGIIKTYEYRMIPYLLSENPDMPRAEAFARSRAMMDGEKWNAFVLDLSFLGWQILSACTFGILGLFYVNPYMDLTNAALYGALKQKQRMSADPFENPNRDPFWQS